MDDAWGYILAAAVLFVGWRVATNWNKCNQTYVNVDPNGNIVSDPNLCVSATGGMTQYCTERPVPMTPSFACLLLGGTSF